MRLELTQCDYCQRNDLHGPSQWRVVHSRIGLDRDICPRCAHEDLDLDGSDQ